MNITRACAEFAAGMTYEDIPVGARAWAQAGICDVVAVTFAAAGGEIARSLAGSGAVAGLATSRDASGQCDGPAELVAMTGLAGWAPATEAALVMGTIGHALDYDDVGGFGHTSTVLAPVIFALSQRTDISGEEAVAAYVAGFEVGSRIGDRNVFGPIDIKSHHRGQHPTSIFGTVAAAAAAARLLRLSADQTAMALGIAASQSCGLHRNFGTMTKPLHAGIAARAGVQAALLAAKGFTADDDSLAGFLKALNPVLAGDEERQRELMNSFGQYWELARGLAFKQFPAGWSTHRAVTGMLDIMERERIEPEHVAEVEVDLRQTPLLRIAPATSLEAKFSMAYNVAVTLARGRLPNLSDFEQKSIGAPDVRAVMDKVKHTPEPSQDMVRLAVRMTDGSRFVREINLALGDPGEGFDRTAIIRKFDICATRQLDPQRRAMLAAEILDLSSLSKVGPFVQSLAELSVQLRQPEAENA